MFTNRNKDLLQRTNISVSSFSLYQPCLCDREDEHRQPLFIPPVGCAHTFTLACSSTATQLNLGVHGDNPETSSSFNSSHP